MEWTDAFNLLPFASYGMSSQGVKAFLGTAQDVNDRLRGWGWMEVNAGTHHRGLSPKVEEYHQQYYDAVGNQGDDLQSLIDSANQKNISITSGVDSAYNEKTKTIQLSPSAKKWEFYEEFLHSKVHQKGWKQDEIRDLTQHLKKVKDHRGRKTVGSPARSAEEIIVKRWLIEHGSLVGVGEAEQALLQNQINQLSQHGTKFGY